MVETGKAGATALDYGAIVTTPDVPMERRLAAIYRQLTDIIERFSPGYAAVEKLFFGQNTTTAIAVGQARGVVLLALGEAGVPVVELTPAEVKQAVGGYGRADKRQIQWMVSRLLKLSAPPRPDDAADALAIALTGAHAIRFRRATGDC